MDGARSLAPLTLRCRASFAQQNKMTVENLSIVFGPCFIWMNEDSDTRTHTSTP